MITGLGALQKVTLKAVGPGGKTENASTRPIE
jgi:hypothetical protein